jgi:hypothetical protein
METEKAIDAFIDNHVNEEWMDCSGGYQLLLEACGEELLPGLLRLTKHRVPEIRAAVVSLLAIRRPHTPAMMEIVAPLINDADPLVRIRALSLLPEFGQMAAPLAVDAYALILAEQNSEDQMPRVAAIAFLLKQNVEKWGFLVDDLLAVIEADKSDMAEFLAMSTLVDLGFIELS